VHPCAAYCERHRISQAQLARFVDISPQFLNDIIQGRSRPGDAVKRKIVVATGGEITLQDLVNWSSE
jgi:transcriptional regulator with XRE-family HTH domain